MIDEKTSREKILKFLDENNFSIQSLATRYNLNRADLTNWLNGKVTSTKGNIVITRIIEDYKIR